MPTKTKTKETTPGLTLTKTSKVWYRAADSFGSVIDAAQRRIELGTACWDSGSTETSSHAARFTGTASLTDAVKLAREGWREGTARIIAGLDTITADSAAPALQPAYSWDVAGEQPDIAAYCAGVPEHMATPDPVETRVESVVRLSVPGAYGHKIPARAVETYGIALLSHIRALQTGGRSIALTLGTAVAPRDKPQGARKPDVILCTIPIIEPGMPIDLDRIAMAFHPSMTRRFFFALNELEPDLCILTGAHGKVVRAWPAEHREPNTIYLPDIGTMYDRGQLHDIQTAVAAFGDTLRHAFAQA